MKQSVIIIVAELSLEKFTRWLLLF